MFEFFPAFLPIKTDPLPLSNSVLPALSPIATTFLAFALAFAPIAIAFGFCALALWPIAVAFVSVAVVLGPIAIESLPVAPSEL